MPSIRVNGSPSTTIRSANVPESPSSKLQATNFRSDGRLEDGLPLDAGREAGAAAAAQSGVGDLLDDLGGGQRERPPQPGPASVRLVVGDRGGVDDADAREADPPLGGRARGARRPRRWLTASPRQDRGDLVGGDVGVADAARRRSRPRRAARARACRASRCARHCAPAASKAAATSSAPTETAAASPGTKTLVVEAPSSPPLRQRVDAIARQPAVQTAVEGAGRAERAVAEAEDLVDLDVGARARRPGRASRRTTPRRRPTGTPRRGRAPRCARPAARCGSPCRSVTTPCTSATDRFSTSAIASTSSRAMWPSSSTIVVEDGHQRAAIGEVLGGDGADERDPVGVAPTGVDGMGGSSRLRTGVRGHATRRPVRPRSQSTPVMAQDQGRA